MFTRVVTCLALAFTLMSAEYVGAQTLSASAAVDDAANVAATQPPVAQREERRPPVLVPLYLSLIALQVADGVTTLKATRDRNARELNPAMRPFASNGASMFLIKTSSTAATMFAVEKLWKKNRVAAVLTMIGVNAAYAAVVAHNVRALK